MKPSIKWLLLLTILLAACSAGNEPTPTPTPTRTASPAPTETAKPEPTLTPEPSPTPLVEECIRTAKEFIYQMPINIPPKETEPVLDTLPLPPWEYVLELPDGIKGHNVQVEITREIKGKKEIWIRAGANYIVFNPETSDYYLVSRNPMNASVNKETPLTVEPLFVAQDGKVWGKHKIYKNVEFDNKSFPLFSIYNEKKGYFELYKSDIQYDYKLFQRRWINPEEDTYVITRFSPERIFWIFHSSDGLIIFDPVTQTTEEYSELNNIRISNAVITSGGIAILQKAESWSNWELDEGEILYFDPVTKALNPIDIPTQPWPDYGNFVETQNGEIWLGKHGYFSLDGTWHLENPLPEIYIDLGRTSTSYNWQQPNLNSQSSNGYLWFSNNVSSETIGQSGTAWLDPETGEGCWFTSYGGTVVEDSQGTYWIVVDGKLYKNSELN